ncbi:hypothetical protein AB0C87_24740 [Actinomadura sp. NPDC048021]|uniref:hypothetical protein n=1 Tax=Actinomadura sp. NPDC048021 TaxID=3155385 RepID=UPI0034095F9A
MAKTADGPWNLPRMVNVRRGERLNPNDAQHRTKGARNKKTYRTSDRPDGLGSDFIAEFDQLNARERRKLRRKLERDANAASGGLVTRPAPALKEKSLRHTSDVIAHDQKWHDHDDMKGKDTKTHRAMHARLGIGLHAGEGCCK